jgi:hypothetical protein
VAASATLLGVGAEGEARASLGRKGIRAASGSRLAASSRQRKEEEVSNSGRGEAEVGARADRRSATSGGASW